MTQPQERPPLDTEQLIRQADTLRKIVAWADERVDNDGDSEVKHDLEASATALTDAAAELSRLRETPSSEELERGIEKHSDTCHALSWMNGRNHDATQEDDLARAAADTLREIFQRQSNALAESRKEIEARDAEIAKLETECRGWEASRLEWERSGEKHKAALWDAIEPLLCVEWGMWVSNSLELRLRGARLSWPSESPLPIPADFVRALIEKEPR